MLQSSSKRFNMRVRKPQHTLDQAHVFHLRSGMFSEKLIPKVSFAFEGLKFVPLKRGVQIGGSGTPQAEALGVRLARLGLVNAARHTNEDEGCGLELWPHFGARYRHKR